MNIITNGIHTVNIDLSEKKRDERMRGQASLAAQW